MYDHLAETYERSNRPASSLLWPMVLGLAAFTLVAVTCGHIALSGVGTLIARGFNPTMICSGVC